MELQFNIKIRQIFIHASPVKVYWVLRDEADLGLPFTLDCWRNYKWSWPHKWIANLLRNDFEKILKLTCYFIWRYTAHSWRKFKFSLFTTSAKMIPWFLNGFSFFADQSLFSERKRLHHFRVSIFMGKTLATFVFLVQEKKQNFPISWSNSSNMN